MTTFSTVGYGDYSPVTTVGRLFTVFMYLLGIGLLGVVIDQNGRAYTNENIDQLLYSRHMAQKVRQAGGRLKGPKKRQKENNEKFEKGFTELIQQAKT